jgi:hypothetical protein
VGLNRKHAGPDRTKKARSARRTAKVARFFCAATRAFIGKIRLICIAALKAGTRIEKNFGADYSKGV